jgi:hypothetical protein
MATPVDEIYIETRDIYLEILWQAQRVEDQKLVALIKKRLAQGPQRVSAAEPFGKIIPFPLLAAGTTSMARLPLPKAEPTLWPRRPALQGLSLFSAYCVVVLFFIFLQHI